MFSAMKGQAKIKSFWAKSMNTSFCRNLLVKPKYQLNRLDRSCLAWLWQFKGYCALALEYYICSLLPNYKMFSKLSYIETYSVPEKNINFSKLFRF